MRGVTLATDQARVETPVLGFARYGIAFHFVGAAPLGEPPRKTSPELLSFERDLLSYSYRDDPPLATQALEVPGPLQSLEVVYPARLEYLAEGRRVRLDCAGAERGERVRAVRLRASRTTFGSGVAVLHLALVHDPEDPRSEMNEYDLIKLAKLWEGGEGLGENAPVAFRAPGQAALSIADLAAAVAQEPAGAWKLRSGTLQLLTEPAAPGSRELWVRLWHQLGAIAQAMGRDPYRLAGALDEGGLRPALLALAGLVQGLLDFESCDDHELLDVLAETEVRAGRVLALFKGTLLTIEDTDRALEAASGTVGTSPYLLVPHALLLHNEELLRRAAQAAERAAGSRGQALDAARRRIHLLLDRHWLPDLFHYRSERRIFELGMASRGMKDLHQDLSATLAEIQAAWEADAHRRRRLAEDCVAGLLLVLSGAQLHPTVPLLVILPALSVAAAIYLWWQHWRS